MDEKSIKISLLTIAFSGLLMCISAGILYLLRQLIAPYIRFLLPIPPLGVAAYVFVSNLYKHYEGDLPAQGLTIFGEILISTLVATIIFYSFTVLLILAIQHLKEAL